MALLDLRQETECRGHKNCRDWILQGRISLPTVTIYANPALGLWFSSNKRVTSHCKNSSYEWSIATAGKLVILLNARKYRCGGFCLVARIPPLTASTLKISKVGRRLPLVVNSVRDKIEYPFPSGPVFGWNGCLWISCHTNQMDVHAPISMLRTQHSTLEGPSDRGGKPENHWYHERGEKKGFSSGKSEVRSTRNNNRKGFKGTFEGG